MVEPIDRVRTTAYKERGDIIDKVNELIEGIEAGDYQGITKEQFDEWKTPVEIYATDAQRTARQAWNEVLAVSDSVESSLGEMDARIVEQGGSIASLQASATAMRSDIEYLNSADSSIRSDIAGLQNDVADNASAISTASGGLSRVRDFLDDAFAPRADGTITKLGTQSFGSATNPIYIENGVPKPSSWGGITGEYEYVSDGEHDGSWLKAMSANFISADGVVKRVHFDILIDDGSKQTFVRVFGDGSLYPELMDGMRGREFNYRFIQVYGEHDVSFGLNKAADSQLTAYRLYIRLTPGMVIKLIRYSDDTTAATVFDTESTSTFVGDAYVNGQTLPTTQFSRVYATTNAEYILIDNAAMLYDIIHVSTINNVKRLVISREILLAINHSFYESGTDTESSISLQRVYPGQYNGNVFVGSQSYLKNGKLTVVTLFMEPREEDLLNNRIPLKRVTYTFGGGTFDAQSTEVSLIVFTPASTAEKYARFDFSNDHLDPTAVSGTINNGAIYYRNPSHY